MTTAFRSIVCAVVALTLGLALALELHFVDVGQGDAVVLVAPDGRAVVYDGGPGADTLLRYLRGLGVDEVVLVVASHAHADHIGGLPAVLDAYRPRYVLDNGIEHTTQTFDRYLSALERSGAEVLEPAERTITLGEVRLHVLPSPLEPAWGHNDNSVGLVIEYGEFRATLTGDAERRQFTWWLDTVPELFERVHVHKASHHGSDAGDVESALALLAPEVVVIGAGRDNGYGHPHPGALGRYFDVGALVYRTDWHGSVVIRAQLDGSFGVDTVIALPPMTREHLDAGAPTAEPVAAAAPAGGGATAAGACVDLNSASPERLQDIVHIGPERAAAIARLRPIRSVDDLRRVDGIGPARLHDIVAQGVACVG